MLVVLKCLGCKNWAIVSKECSGYCDKCKIQLQIDPMLTKELCSEDNEKERRRLEKLVNNKTKSKKKGKKSKIKHKKTKKKKKL